MSPLPHSPAPRRACAPLLWALAFLLWAAPASANEFDEFQRAREAYDAGDYPTSVARFEALVGGEIPRLQNRPLLIESHKYLAASYLFVGDAAAAQAQFDALLELEPDYVLDPLGFPREVQQVFDEARKRRFQAQARAEAEARARAEADAQAALEAAAERRQRFDRLLTLAATERVEERNSRWVATLPFGIGQYQNGDFGLGLALSITGGVLLATNITSWAMHRSFRGEVLDADNRQELVASEERIRVTNQLSLGLLVAVAIAGIIDAQIRFEPARVYERRRPVPPALLEPPPDIGLGPGGLRVRF